VAIWTPDKDLAQCVRGERVVQIDRKGKKIRDEAGVREKFGVVPTLIPDYLALVGDAADGYPGVPGIGAVTAARLLNTHGAIESVPPRVLGDNRDLALLFKVLATLKADAPLFSNVDALRWDGPTPAFAEWSERMEAPRLLERARKAAAL
jgi:5'-3' exonuclease